MRFLDSLPPADMALANILFKKLWKLFKLTGIKAGISGLPRSKSWKLEIPVGPIQPNGVDCGLYVCLAMRAALLGISFEVDATKLVAMRKSIIKAFQEWPQGDAAPESLNLQSLRVEEVFTALTIPGGVIHPQKRRGKATNPPPAPDVHNIGERHPLHVDLHF